jgi:DNA-directed RNA polymerase subunit N (RpoN/RPB10)
MEKEIPAKGRLVKISNLGKSFQPPKSKDTSFVGATTEIPPIRCYSCGKVIGHLYDLYNRMLADNLTPAEIFDVLNIKRVCCRIRIANPAVIATAKYIEDSEVLDDEEDLFQEKEQEQELDADDMIRKELERKEKEKSKNEEKIKNIQSRLKKLTTKEKEVKKPEQPKRISHYYAT